MSKNNNFVDQAFTVIADVLLKVLPISNREKSAFTYYREGTAAIGLLAIFFYWSYSGLGSSL